MGVRGERTERRRDALLAVAGEMFLAKGYDGVPIDAVIDEAGGTKTNIYTVFGGKAKLFEAVVTQLCGKHAPSGPQALADGAPARALREFGEEYLALALSKAAIRLQRLVTAEASRFPALGKLWLKTGPDAARATVVDFLAAKGLSSAEASKRAGQFLDLLNGALQRPLVTGARALSSQEIAAHAGGAAALVLQGTKLER